jgi:hypothetical protein
VTFDHAASTATFDDARLPAEAAGLRVSNLTTSIDAVGAALHGASGSGSERTFERRTRRQAVSNRE